MKQFILKSVIALALVTGAVACKKSSSPAPAPAPVVDANIMSGVYAGKSMEDITATYELGLKFTSSLSGKVTKIKVKTPSTGSKRVSLWRASDGALLGTYFVNATSTTEFSAADVNIAISGGQQYVISVNLDRYYRNWEGTMFPANSGSITILSSQYKGGAAQVFPNAVQNITDGVFGLIDFDFQRN
jgi:hypothetical protein